MKIKFTCVGYGSDFLESFNGILLLLLHVVGLRVVLGILILHTSGHVLDFGEIDQNIPSSNLVTV
jgi:hypothetical protein